MPFPVRAWCPCAPAPVQKTNLASTLFPGGRKVRKPIVSISCLLFPRVFGAPVCRHPSGEKREPPGVFWGPLGPGTALAKTLCSHVNKLVFFNSCYGDLDFRVFAHISNSGFLHGFSPRFPIRTESFPSVAAENYCCSFFFFGFFLFSTFKPPHF